MEKRGLIEALGTKIWSAVHDPNWRAREAAAKSLLTVLKLKKKFKVKNSILFQAIMEMALIFCAENVPSIYNLGLQIIACCCKPEILDNKIEKTVVARNMHEVVELLGRRIGELNLKTRHLSLFTLVSLFHNPYLDFQSLLNWFNEVCDREREVALFGRHSIPIVKQPAKVLVPRLEVLAQALIKFPEAEEFNQCLQAIVVPALGHSDAGVKSRAVEVTCLFYQKNRSQVLGLLEKAELNPHLIEWLNLRFKELDHIEAAQEQPKVLKLPQPT